MSEQVLFVRLFTDKAIEYFKAKDRAAFENCTPLAKDKAADLTANPLNLEWFDDGVYYGVAKLMSRAAAVAAATSWHDTVRSLSNNAALPAKSAYEIAPVEAITDDVKRVVSRRAELLAFDRLTNLAEDLMSKLVSAPGSSSNGGGPRLKRPAAPSMPRAGSKHFKRRLVATKKN